MNELTKIKQRILERLITYAKDMEKAGALTNDIKVVIGTVKLIIDSEFERTANEQLHTEHIIKTTIKEYLDKDYDDVTEMLLDLNKDLCERIRKESENGL